MPIRQEHLLLEDMRSVVDVLHREQDDVTPYRQDYRDLLDNHGKMIRASLVLIFSYGLGARPEPASETIVTGAAAIEMLHLATLVHDDVLDDAPIRRNKPTVHTLRGNKAAIYLGDLLLSRYMEIMAGIAPSTGFIAYHAHTVNEIVAGDLLQESARHDTAITRERYRRAISGKTAALFRLACTTGLELSGIDPSSPLISLARDFGENLGVAFQIVDDIEDFNVAHDTGKPKLEDIRDGIYTLPVILALEDDPSFADVVRADDPARVLAYLDAHPQYIERAKDAVRARIERARKTLGEPGSQELNAETRDLLSRTLDKLAATL
ncbi:polyprenyl synthetase family protein [Bifidobacterium sp. ESL0763]|uniref:polyprenyl synthetase family protein n=1 Tax=Bifidobacterium sp. ESL0763 TaxID=2983227 RepID=UPI0023F84C2D|nr:polyprenyl synthetase family protein [Bifidobacterium sp. ESL0763]MDF7663526.1 polyprenyl synthetase family protein [Bifidobacterium sp. ESL0763]